MQCVVKFNIGELIMGSSGGGSGGGSYARDNKSTYDKVEGINRDRQGHNDTTPGYSSGGGGKRPGEKGYREDLNSGRTGDQRGDR